jgi:hypothetical protein
MVMWEEECDQHPYFSGFTMVCDRTAIVTIAESGSPAIVFFGWVTGGTTSNDGNGGGTMEGLYQVDRGFGKVVTGYADTSAKWEVFGGIAVFSRYMLFSQC